MDASCAEQRCVIDNPWVTRLIQASRRRFRRLVHANGVGSGGWFMRLIQADGSGGWFRRMAQADGSGGCLRLMVQTKGSDGKNNRLIADTRWRRATRRG